MILLTFENDKNTAIKTEEFTSARVQLTCSDVIPTFPIVLLGPLRHSLSHNSFQSERLKTLSIH